MKYNYEYAIKYQEVDGKKRLRLFNLENYLLEVAGTVADDLGFGIQVLHPRGLTWILTRLSVEMYELPRPCEHIRFETWLEKREIVNAFDDPMFEDCVDGEVIDLPRVRMTTIPEPTGIAPHKIVYSDIDYNGHCNSCKYLQAMTDAFLPDYYGKKVRLDISYSKEAMLGEQMNTHYLVTDDGVQYQMKNEAGETSCSAKITVSELEN